MSMISAVMELEPCGPSSLLLNPHALSTTILNVVDPIAFGTPELECGAALGIRDYLPH